MPNRLTFDVGPAESWAVVLRALADLLWPLVVLTAVIMFRQEISRLITRIRKGKLFGQEFELDPQLDQLHEAANRVSDAVPGTPDPAERQAEEDDITARSARVLEEASKSPHVALMILSREIERELRQLVAALPIETRHDRHSVPALLMILESKLGIPDGLRKAVSEFWSVRSKVIHGHTASDHDVLRAIDSGLVLLAAIARYPHERNVVYRADVGVFSDPEGREQRGDVWAVILECFPTDEPMERTKRIFPTTRRGYQPGKPVSWEWDTSKTWGESWYQDPDSGVVAHAWSSSAEFVGRHLEEL